MKRDRAELTGWLTFCIDMLGMLASFFLSGYIRSGILVPGFMTGIYGNLLVVLLIAIIGINYLGETNKNILKRGYYVELVSIMKEQGKLAFIVFGYMFAVHVSSSYSRIFLTLFFVFNILITYILRSYMKLILMLGYKKSNASNKVMLVTVSKNVGEIIRKIRSEYEWMIYTDTIAILDKNRIGDRIEGIEVVANRDNLFEMARLKVVDEVFINIPRNYQVDMEELILEFEKMGVIVHVNIELFGNLQMKEKRVDEFAGHHVITFASSMFEPKYIILKRFIDIIGGLTGCILIIFLMLILAPAIKLESKGPLVFSQTRVGKNGRRFKIYKFRSMYQDAEERKKELMNQNEMKGLMFKITDDPRITKVGKFIRKTSLDEFPQFFNVLMGDMSLVGTRPPTEDEFLQYEGRHKRRLMMKPGLTGLWQVSGRSDVENFEDVVKMDLKYIDNWSMGLDVKLIVKTIGVVLFGRGAK